MSKSWTLEEIIFLRDNANTLSTAEIAERLDRSIHSVCIKRNRLGLTSSNRKRQRASIYVNPSESKSIPRQRNFDLRIGDVITAPYIRKSAHYIGSDENTIVGISKICKYTVTAIYPYIFQARLEETEDAGVIRELTKNAYISGEIKRYKPKRKY